jgi:4-amino-4-deoxy-L-arabinose transferase-like glycosyltransferase
MSKGETLDRRIAWGLFIVGLVVLWATEKAAGFVRDESVYFAAAEQHARWFQLLLSAPSEAFSDAAISRFFDFNHEHPALMKNLFGVSFLIFHEGLGLMRPAAAFRLPAFAFAAAILPLTYLLAKPHFGRMAALFGAASFLLVPRQFFEAHLSCFDVPIATMWLLTVYCFVQALERPRWWVYAGIAFGLALGTKHNAYFIPMTLVPFALVQGWQRSQNKAEARTLFVSINGAFVFAIVLYGVMGAALGLDGVQSSFQFLSAQTGLYMATVAVGSYWLWRLHSVDVPTFRAVAPLVAMAVLGPVIFYLHWPYLWHHPVDRTAWYLAFHATHNHYAWFYLGEVLRAPPFPLAYVLVKTALTVPTSLLAPMVLGAGWVLIRAARRQSTFIEWLVLANAATSIVVISLPNVPHFGGVKHWFPSMPFLGILGGVIVAQSAKGAAAFLKGRWPSVTAPMVFGSLFLASALPAAITNARVYPYGTSHYSELAGGLPGAASLGMQRQFWANNVTGVLDWINQNARPGERVYLHECHGGQVSDYRRNGMLRQDLGVAGSPFDADIVAYQYHQEFREHEFDTWQAFGTTKPVFGLYVDETPQVVVYRRR